MTKKREIGISILQNKSNFLFHIFCIINIKIGTEVSFSNHFILHRNQECQFVEISLRCMILLLISDGGAMATVSKAEIMVVDC